MKKDGKMLEEKSKEFLTVNFSTNKTLFNLDVLKGKMSELNYLLSKGYLIEIGETVDSLHYEITLKGKEFLYKP